MKRLAIYHIETLLWIARLGTFRAAAERLNTTQPAISARVKEIEEQLGVDLFRREGRNMVLTARGRALVADFEPLWAGFERALFKASDFAGATGIVRLGTGEIAAATCLPAFVAAVEQDLPGVTLEIEVDLTARMLQQLLGTSDMVFLAGPVASPGVRTTSLGSVGPVWAASQATGRREASSNRFPSGRSPNTPIHGITRELAQPRHHAPGDPHLQQCARPGRNHPHGHRRRAAARNHDPRRTGQRRAGLGPPGAQTPDPLRSRHPQRSETR
jgi:DNA-binding transcriptional LysR family regulator